MRNLNSILICLCRYTLACLIFLGFFSCTPKVSNWWNGVDSDYYYEYPTDKYGNTTFIKGMYCGLKNASGEVLIPSAKYIYIKPFTYDNSCEPHRLYKAETRYADALVRENGTVVLPAEYSRISGCKEGLISAHTDAKDKVIDVEGKEVIPMEYDWLSLGNDRLIIAQKFLKKGVVNTSNEKIVPFKYDWIEVVSKDTIYVYTGPIDSIRRGSLESYQTDAYFDGVFTENVVEDLEIFHIDSDVKDIEEGIKNESVHTKSTEMPRFPGCEDRGLTDDGLKMCCEKKMLEFIYSNIKYPRQARLHSIEGMVVASFVVEKDGAVSNISLLRDVRGGCGDESLKIVRQMPRWIPGKKDGELVRVRFNLPVRFKLEG